MLRRDDQLCVMTVHAHPDDEASKGAPTMAKYGSQGVRTVLVCCTGGEEGDVANPTMRHPGEPFHEVVGEEEKALLATLRPLELAKSAEIIGFHRVEMLGYRDSGMLDSPANAHPECFHMAEMDEAVGRLVKLIREERPHVLVTYNDDHSGYPHPDHVKVHEISVRAFDRAADDEWYPEFGEPWQPLKLYYSAWSRMRITAIHEALLGVPVRRGLVLATRRRPPHHHPHPDRRLHLGSLRVATRPSHADRRERTVLVRSLGRRTRPDLSL